MVERDKDDSLRRIMGRSHKGGEATKQVAMAKHQLWQETADKVWKEHPRWGKGVVGDEVRLILGCQESGATIARKIKKPSDSS